MPALSRAFKALAVTGLLASTLLAPEADAAIYNGPYMLQVSQRSVTLMWESDSSSIGTVEYGTSTAYGQKVSETASATMHKLVLENLSAQTVYYYRVTDSSGDVRTGRFSTAPKPGADFSFAAYGDNRSNPDDHTTVAKAILSRSPALVVTTGDYVETTGIHKQWHNQFFVPAADLLSNTPILPAIGNHDSTVGHPRSPVYKYFPKPGSTNYYSFDYGDIHFVVIDSNVPYNQSSSQYAWLQGDLAATLQPIIIAVHHFPVYSSGNHGSTADMDVTLRPLYEAYGVRAVLNGHDHMYEHSVRNGLHYFVLGGGGADLYSTGDNPNPYAVKSESTLNYAMFNYKGGVLSLTAYRTDGTVIESVALNAPTAARQSPSALPDEDGATTDEATGCSFGGSDEAAGAGVLSLALFAGLALVRRRRR